MNKKDKSKGIWRLYLKWPLILSILMFFINIIVYIVNHKSGIVMLLCSIVYAIIAMAIFFYQKKTIQREMIRFAASY